MAVAAGFPPTIARRPVRRVFPLLARRSGTPARAWSPGRAFPFSPHSHSRRVRERRPRRVIPLRSLHPAVGNDGAEPGPPSSPHTGRASAPGVFPYRRRDACRGSAGRPSRREEIIAKQHNGRAGVLTLGAPARCFPVPGRIPAVGGESPRPWGYRPPRDVKLASAAPRTGCRRVRPRTHTGGRVNVSRPPPCYRAGGADGAAADSFTAIRPHQRTGCDPDRVAPCFLLA